MKKYQLMAPGPTPVPSEVLLAMAQPILHHRTAEYEALFVEVRAGLKRLVQTTQDVIPLACSGTGAMEAALVSTLSPGDTVAVVTAGKFGQRRLPPCKGPPPRPVGVAAAPRGKGPAPPPAQAPHTQPPP